MPDRIIRDEMLRSERYWSVSIEAQRLFVHIILNVDDTARFSGKNYTLRAACYPGQAMEPDKLERLLAELVDTDLVRVYMHNNERFIFVPRFRQRLRFKKSRYPEPPSQINDIPKEKTDLSQPSDGLETGSRRQKRREEKRSKTYTLISFARFWDAYPRKVAKGKAEKQWLSLDPDDQLLATILQAIDRARDSAEWRKDGGQFIPYPATWLHQRRWEDEAVVQQEILV